MMLILLQLKARKKMRQTGNESSEELNSTHAAPVTNEANVVVPEQGAVAEVKDSDGDEFTKMYLAKNCKQVR